MTTRLRPLLTAVCLGLALAAPLTPAFAQDQAAAAAPAGIQPTHVELTGPGDRAIDVSVWTAPNERGVIVFGHGHGGRPEAYQKILSRWAEAGFTVVAPLHVDSLDHPRHDDFNRFTGFVARLEDLAVARAFIARTHPVMPLIAAGHSFGSLMSTLEAGALTPVGPQGDPAVKAVVLFSSAGNVPGLITPQSYQSLTAPLLMITGDRDQVEGFAADWRDHRAAYDLSPPGGRMLMVFEGGDHSLVGNADADDFERIVAATTDFMAAYALNDAEARARVTAMPDAPGLTIERR